MSKVLDLGKLVDVHPGLGILPPLNFAAFGNGDSLNGDDHNGDSHNGDDHNGNSHTTNDLTLPVIDDKTVAEKAVKDAQDTPSIWFVNFPNTSALGQKKLLGKYMQNVTDYRSWASLVWWKTVFSEKGVPQDGSTASAAARSAYCAKVAAHHMKLTPWLAMSIDHNISKTIECKTTEFHTELITNVLDGFVGLTPNVFGALEGILKSLSKSSSQTAKTAETKTIVCERYEYIPQADLIKSYVRIVNFSVTESMRNVNNAKKTESRITCTIDYNEYEASFNQKLWKKTADGLNEQQKKAADAFVTQSTVDCPP